MSQPSETAFTALRSDVRRAELLFDQAIVLGAGEEWHSHLIPLELGDDLKVQCRGDHRFYAGFLHEVTYGALRARSPHAFPFRFGRDEVTFDRTFPVMAAGGYRVVLRVGGWTPASTISVRLERILASDSGRAYYR